MRLFQFAVGALALCLSCIARASDVPCAGSLTNPITKESHAWIADTVRTASGQRAYRILHLPPRGTDAKGHRGASDGAVRVATILAEPPEALAAIDNRLYMAFAPSLATRGVAPRRQVLMLEAERGSLDGVWISEAGSGRLPVMASLPGDAFLRGFVGCPAGPVALIDEPGFDGVPEEELLLLRDGAWVSLPLPDAVRQRRFDPVRLNPEQGPQDTGIRLIARTDGVSLMLIDGDRPGEWSIKLDAKTVPADATAWAWSPLNFESSSGGAGRIRPSGSVFRLGDRDVFERRVFGDLELWMVESSGCRRMATVSGVSPGYGLTPLYQTGRIALVWWAAPKSTAANPRTSEGQTRIVEVSGLTGQVLFDGEVERQLPFSGTDVKVLAVFLVLVMLAIVVFVLRPDKEDPPLSLPKGVFLAEPGRRMVAAAIDAGIALAISSQATGIGWAQITNLDTVLKESSILWLFLMTIGVGMIVGTLSEWVFGRTSGKVLTGCEVMRVKSVTQPSGEVVIEISRPQLWRAAVRNLIKWMVSPVAMAGVTSGERRHRGDLAAGTVVVTREEPEEA